MVKVVFIHPDLGIGGAERLVIDAALALQKKGHQVEFFTAHHDTSHCFPETQDGRLTITCVGDWLPRTLLGKMAALCAYVRMIYVSLYLSLFSGLLFDIAFVDQVSVCIPFLKLKRRMKIVFYCHYPDQLLTDRKSFMKRFYRYCLDFLEEKTTGMADCVLVNSYFTANVFKQTFLSIRELPSVLYPSLETEKFDVESVLTFPEIGVTRTGRFCFLSINRYERKKNVILALQSLKRLLDSVGDKERCDIHLIIAGGYDQLVEENVSYYRELCVLASRLGLQEHVTFLRSPSDEAKVLLLRSAMCLLYTPDREHFGIVPLEAMYCGTPVIAVNSGGPTETIVHGSTGFLCPQTPEAFCEAMCSFVHGNSLKSKMGMEGRKHVLAKFSFEQFSNHLHYIMQGLVDERKKG